MSSDESTTLDAYQKAQKVRYLAAKALAAAQEAYLGALEAEKETRYQAVIAVPCPPLGCGAPAGQQCQHEPGFNLHRYVTHGLREDLSGVNGEANQKRAQELYTTSGPS